jgi:catechol 2,3-dioxygenase-like lactoylglutathione lyase family enzyme
MSMPGAALPILQHVTFTYPPGQEATLRQFYSVHFGLREKRVPKVVSTLGWIWFQTGEPKIELHFVPDERPNSPETTHHFCLHVDDLEACRKSLENAGFAVQAARPLPFRPRFFTRDPFNNLIEVVHLEGDYLVQDL